jgi:hypothetical protein
MGTIRFNKSSIELSNTFNSAKKYTNFNVDSAVYAIGGTTVHDIEQSGIKYRIHSFFSSGTFQVLRPIQNLEYIVVAGGGAGGTSETNTGGGGAGGLRTATESLVLPNTYYATVGRGGVSSWGKGLNGLPSLFLNLSTVGGGGGGGLGDRVGSTGGSGGGAGVGGVNSVVGGSGTSGEGNKGGDATPGNCGGGGGNTGAGGNNTGVGGTGFDATTFFATTIKLAGGGGGRSTNTGNASGTDGGGSGGGNAGTDGTGGGGGALNSGRAGKGGDGAVYIKYRIG